MRTPPRPLDARQSEGVAHSGEGGSRTRRSDAGDTLIEVLIALVVLSIASIALLTAFGASISASNVHRNATILSTVMSSVSQQVIADMDQTAQQSLFTGCPSSAEYPSLPEYPSLSGLVPSPYSSQYTASYVTSNSTTSVYPVQWWNSATSSFTYPCPSGYSDGPQLITIEVVDNSNGLASYNSFVVTLPGSTENAVVTSSTAAGLIFAQEPGAGTGTPANTPLATQPWVEVVNSAGAPVTTDYSPVMLSIQTESVSGTTLTGCSGEEIDGYVYFSGCSLSAVGTYTLLATDPSDAIIAGSTFATAVSTPAFTIGGAEDELSFAVQPSAGNSGAALATDPEVQVLSATDVYQSTWTGTITLTVSGGDLTGCTGSNLLSSTSRSVTLSTSTGEVSVPSSCDFAGGYRYDVADNTYLPTPYLFQAVATPSGSFLSAASATSSLFSVSGPGAATQLIFTSEPTGAAATTASGTGTGVAFQTQPAVTLEDSFGNVASTSTNSVTLSISSGSLTCTGGTSVAASFGVATFTGCSGSKAGTGIYVTASATGFTSITSNAFNITGAATSLVFATEPVAGESGTAFPTEPVLNIYSGTTLVTAASSQIGLTSSGGLLSLCSGLSPDAGYVNIATCQFAGLVGTPYYLSATFVNSLGATLTATSQQFTPTNFGAATQLVFTTEPVAGASGSGFTSGPVIAVEDSGGNVVTSSSASVAVSASGGTLSSACATMQTVEGVVDAGDCTFTGVVGTPYTLTVASSLLASATSSSFTPSGPGPATHIVLSGCSSNISWNTSCVATATIEDVSNNVEVADNSSVNFVQTNSGSGSGAVSGLGSGAAVRGVASTTLKGTLPGTITIDATDLTDGLTSSSQSFSVIPATQTVAFYTNNLYVTTTTGTSVSFSASTPYQLYAEGSGSGVITFSSTTPSVCSVNSSTGVVTLLATGSCHLTAQAGATTDYAASGTTGYTLSVYAADGTGTLTLATPTTFAASSTANTLTFTYTAVTGGISNGAVSFAVPTGWSAPTTHDHRRRLHHRLDRRGRRQWTDHHRVGRHPGRRRHAHRHLRQQGERRTRRDRSPHDGRGDLDGPGDVDRHRHTHRARDLALDHRLRGQRHGDAHARVPDHLRGVLHRQHPHLHLHRRRRRHQQR